MALPAWSGAGPHPPYRGGNRMATTTMIGVAERERARGNRSAHWRRCRWKRLCTRCPAPTGRDRELGPGSPALPRAASTYPSPHDPMGVGRRFLARGRESSPVCGVLAEGIDGPHIIIHNCTYESLYNRRHGPGSGDRRASPGRSHPGHPDDAPAGRSLPKREHPRRLCPRAAPVRRLAGRPARDRRHARRLPRVAV